ncbi:MAG: hypothetical protein NUV80_02435 [Candidatus Berkelbacteria bacterium]|nr:hypothetical protein [Candidatus Berkelbacteria bacterium]
MIDYIISSFTTGRCEITVLQQITAGVSIVIGLLAVFAVTVFLVVVIQTFWRKIKT